MKHLLLELKIKGRRSNAEITSIFHQACDKSEAHIRKTVEYSFYPKGLSAMVLLAERHATIHTWPEDGKMICDYFSCAKSPKFDEFIDFFVKNKFEVVKKEVIKR